MTEEGWYGFLPTHIPALATAKVYAVASYDEEDDDEPGVHLIAPWYGV